ncbi:MAG: hypothetical protein ABUT20_66415, partial [Bacteroidota bacterium]
KSSISKSGKKFEDRVVVGRQLSVRKYLVLLLRYVAHKSDNRRLVFDHQNINYTSCLKTISKSHGGI